MRRESRRAVNPDRRREGIAAALLRNLFDQADRPGEQYTLEVRPSNAAAYVYAYHVSPDYLHAEGTTLLAGRAFTWHDDKDLPRIAVVNQEFARKIFG